MVSIRVLVNLRCHCWDFSYFILSLFLVSVCLHQTPKNPISFVLAEGPALNNLRCYFRKCHRDLQIQKRDIKSYGESQCCKRSGLCSDVSDAQTLMSEVPYLPSSSLFFAVFVTGSILRTTASSLSWDIKILLVEPSGSHPWHWTLFLLNVFQYVCVQSGESQECEVWHSSAGIF